MYLVRTFSSLIILTLFTCSVFSSSPSNYFSDKDAEAVKDLALGAVSTDSFHAVSVLQNLGATVANKETLCSAAKGRLSSAATNVEEVSQSILTLVALGCAEKASAQLTGVLENALESGDMNQIYAALTAISALKSKNLITLEEDVTEAATAIQELLEVDGTFKANEGSEANALYAGLAYHCLAILKKNFKLTDDAEEAFNAVVASVEDLFDNVEEDEGAFEFSNDNALETLKTTSMVLTGLNALAATTGEVTLSQEHLVGFAEYFVRNKKINNVADADYLLQGLKTIATNNFKVSPLVITLDHGSVLSTSKGDSSLIKIRVTDIFGKPATTCRVYVTKVAPVMKEKNVILRNQEAQVSTSDSTLYTFGFLATKPEPGFYALSLSAAPLNKNTAFTSVSEVVRVVKVVSAVDVSDLRLQVRDLKDDDDDYDTHSLQLQYPSKSTEELRVNALQRFYVSFKVQVASKPIKVQQAFVVFTNLETQKRAIFVASPSKSGKQYQLSVGILDNIDAFEGCSGKYSVAVVIGDALVQNPIYWEVATATLQFGKYQSCDAPSQAIGPLPEIQHKFRVPEKRPPATVSFAFTGAVLAPWLILLIGIFGVGINMSNCPWTNPTALFCAFAFHSCIGAIFTLYVVYWLRLRMVDTLTYLLVLAVPTILFGQQTLKFIASTKQKSE